MAISRCGDSCAHAFLRCVVRLHDEQVANLVRRFTIRHAERAAAAATAARSAARAAVWAAAAASAAAAAATGAAPGVAGAPEAPVGGALLGAALDGGGASGPENDPLDLAALAAELVRLAMRLGSADNITVAVVAFEYAPLG